MQAGRYSQHTQQRIGIQTTKGKLSSEKTNHSTENGQFIYMNEIKGLPWWFSGQESVCAEDMVQSLTGKIRHLF